MEPNGDCSSTSTVNPEPNTLFEAIKSAKIAVEVTSNWRSTPWGCRAAWVGIWGEKGSLGGSQPVFVLTDSGR